MRWQVQLLQAVGLRRDARLRALPAPARGQLQAQRVRGEAGPGRQPAHGRGDVQVGHMTCDLSSTLSVYYLYINTQCRIVGYHIPTDVATKPEVELQQLCSVLGVESVDRLRNMTFCEVNNK